MSNTANMSCLHINMVHSCHISHIQILRGVIMSITLDGLLTHKQSTATATMAAAATVYIL